MIIEYFKNLKNLKPFRVIGTIIILGLIYGGINLYYKTHAFKSLLIKLG